LPFPETWSLNSLLAYLRYVSTRISHPAICATTTVMATVCGLLCSVGLQCYIEMQYADIGGALTVSEDMNYNGLLKIISYYRISLGHFNLLPRLKSTVRLFSAHLAILWNLRTFYIWLQIAMI
jgi:hypothetical protein